MISYAKAINEAMQIAMRKDPKVLCYGLGVTDPKRIFGTTSDLLEEFGPERVFDVPASENALTGIGVGAAIMGYRPVLVHQRVDFALLSVDQIVNAAAKWRMMFGGVSCVPFVIRMVIGRGWGRGRTHSQVLHSWFAQIPGLKVVLPTTPSDASGMLQSAISDDNPVIFMEHRWLHNSVGVVDHFKDVPIGKANLLRNGSDITVVAMSQMTLEAIRASEFLAGKGIKVDLIDLRSVRPIDWETIKSSVSKTGRLLAVDIAPGAMSVASEIISEITQCCWHNLKCAPIKLALPNKATPTSFSLTQSFYPTWRDIVKATFQAVGAPVDLPSEDQVKSLPHDVPDEYFRGPF